jgi:hypothetical protein
VLCCAVLLQLPYTEAVIKEALRLMAPGAIATRFTDQQSLQLTPEVRSEAGNACRIWGVGWGGVGWGGVGWGGVGWGGVGAVPRPNCCRRNMRLFHCCVSLQLVPAQAAWMHCNAAGLTTFVQPALSVSCPRCAG